MSAGPFQGLRVLELCDEKGHFTGKLLGDLGADVVKIEPPGGESCRDIGPFFDDVPHRDRSLYFWHYNTSKRGITLDITRPEGAALLRRLASSTDVVLESFAPGTLDALELGFDALRAQNAGLVMCALTPFGQTGPWRDFVSSDLLHLAAGGEMASCGYDESDVPGDTPIAPGGGNAWHTGAHFAYMAIVAALVHRTVTQQGQFVDVSIHEACALTTEAAIPTYVYRGEVVRRQTGRHHSATPTTRTQFRARDGRYVTALIANQLSPPYVRRLADLLRPYGMQDDLDDARYDDPEFVQAHASHIIEGVVAAYIASVTAEEAYHEAQSRGFQWGAVRPAEALLDDEHLHDRDFWKEVPHPELGRSFTYPGEAAIYRGTPWGISRRAPLVGEHNTEIFEGELGLSSDEVSNLAKGNVI